MHARVPSKKGGSNAGGNYELVALILSLFTVTLLS